MQVRDAYSFDFYAHAHLAQQVSTKSPVQQVSTKKEGLALLECNQILNRVRIAIEEYLLAVTF